jgi:hypothetical protein
LFLFFRKANAPVVKEETKVLRVSVYSAVVFLIIAVVGLNGEQILDASFKLSLRSAHLGSLAGNSFNFVFKILFRQTITKTLAGRRGPMILQHLVTAFARFVAFKTSSFSHFTLIVFWGVSQLVRLAVIGADAAVGENLYLVAGLIMLDK